MTASVEEFRKRGDSRQMATSSGVHKQLKLSKGDGIRYCMEPSGRTHVEPIRASEDDPGLGAFRDFIEPDIKAHPERLQALGGGMLDRLKALVGDVEAEVDEAL